MTDWVSFSIYTDDISYPGWDPTNAPLSLWLVFDQLMINSATEVAFLVDNVEAHASSSETTIFFDDMESGTNGWTTATSETDDLWHQAEKDRDGQITTAWWCGDDDTSNYNTQNRINNSLISPSIVLPAETPITLSFKENFYTEVGWDFCLVAISTNGGQSWTELRGTTSFEAEETALSGSSGGWITSNCGLSDYSGQTVNIRFRFDTVDAASQGYPGWYVDDVLVFKGSTDTDSDGIPDSSDDFPNDADRAFAEYYPSDSNFATLAFEDKWPEKGDYDFNDLVLDYQLRQIKNADGRIVSLIGTFIIQGVGALYENGFGWVFDIPPSRVLNVSGMSLSAPPYDYITLASNKCEAGQTKAVVIGCDNVSSLMPRSEGNYVNTEIGAGYVQPKSLTIVIEFTSPLTAEEAATISPLDGGFLIVNKTRGHEIHLPDKAPTDLADTGLFGTGNDDSDPSKGRYYKTAKNLPWALTTPVSFEYPIETKEILDAYNHFAEWAESSGKSYKSWYAAYSGYRTEANIYNYHDEALANANLIGYWKFDEGTGTKTSDSSGKNHEGTLFNAPTWTTGKFKWALGFDGLNDYIKCGAFDPPAQGTVMFWMKTNAVTGVRNRVLGSDDAYEVSTNTSGNGYIVVNHLWVKGTQTLTGTTVLDFNEWYHVACTYAAGGTKAIYINGELDTSDSRPHNDPGTDVLSIGTRTGKADYFDGILDEVKIYNKVLTQEEVQAQYEL